MVENVVGLDAVVWGFEDRVGEEGDAAGLDGSDHGGLLGRRRIGVDDPDAAERGHGNRHVGFGDGVHWGGDAGDGEGHVAAELGGEVDGVGGEVDVVGEEDDVIVSVGVTLIEEPAGEETVFED